jgi:iron complex transport system substrate-binding protein
VTAGVSVVDALGRTLTFESVPQRIVLAGRALFMIADALYAFPQAAERVVVTGDTGQGGDNNFIALLDPAYPVKAVLAGDASAEQIAAADPDVVVLKSYLAETLGAPLEVLGIPVVYIDLETPEQYARDLEILGQLFQQPERAGELLEYYQTKLFNTTQALASLDETTKPRVLLLYYSDRDGEIAFNVPPMNWMQTTQVEQAGGVPVWADANPGGGWTKVGFEQVAAWDPDAILLVSYFRNVDEVTAELKADPQWQALRAVQDGKLYGFPGDFYSWDQPDTRWILGQMWLAKTLHPDLFADLDLPSELGEFYRTLYALDETTLEQEILPRLKGDL